MLARFLRNFKELSDFPLKSYVPSPVETEFVGASKSDTFPVYQLRFLRSIGESRAYSCILAPIAEHTAIDISVHSFRALPKCIGNFSIGMPKVPQVEPSVALFIHRSLLNARVFHPGKSIAINHPPLDISTTVYATTGHI